MVPCPQGAWGQPSSSLGLIRVKATHGTISTIKPKTHHSEPDSAEGGGVRSEGVRVMILAFCVSELRKSVPRSVPLIMDSWDFCPFFTARSLFSSTSHTAADFARQVD